MSEVPSEDCLEVAAIRTQQITLVDSLGNARARFYTTDPSVFPSSTVVQILGSDGTPKLELQVDDNDPGIRLSSKPGHAGFSVSVNSTSNGLMIGDLNGNAVVELGKYHSQEHSHYGTKPSLVLRDCDTTGDSEGDGGSCIIIQPDNSDG
ncbi:hypothetical protein SH501x_002715 [Pirellulaceae bacterium SH501]